MSNGKKYGGLEGPDAEWVKVVSCEGHEYIFKKEQAKHSPILTSMLNSHYSYEDSIRTIQELYAQMSFHPRTYGGIEGPDAVYLKLISSDGHEFIIKKEMALASGTIKSMLSGPSRFSDTEMNEVYFNNVPSHLLKKVCEFMMYKKKYLNSKIGMPMFKIEKRVAFELLKAASFLDL